MSEPITSVRNPRVQAAAALARRRERRATGRHLVEGPNAVAEAVRAGVVDEIFVTATAAADLDAGPATVHEVPDHVLARLADATSPQGIVAVARTVTAALGDVVGHGLLVVLHQVADPGNVGTILRTADAAGAAGVVLTAGSADPFGPKSIRAAVGSTYHLDVVVDADIEALAAAARAAGQPLLGLAADGEHSVFDLASRPPPLALVLGNEAHGLDPDATRLLDGLVAIPRWGRAESLNVAAAAAVAVYAAARAVHAPSRPTGPR
jgi:TrmH family RNA methyltransferase